MDVNKIQDIVENPQDKSNKDLGECEKFLYVEFEKTKDQIVTLTRYLDKVESSYNLINEELSNRFK
jgi:hypothetical protein|tara:strand:- start:1711 stop:1908 length:198 start_codon:yes stop_codon:yes gene_type:complete